MGKYTDIETDIFSVFGTVQWKAEGITTVPNAFPIGSNETIRVSILKNGSRGVVDGLLLIDIFIVAGKGPKRLSEIADKLDSYLAQKTLSTHNNGSLQCYQSSMDAGKEDRDNPLLVRSTYSLPFKYYGA